jgi:hypothetical protein
MRQKRRIGPRDRVFDEKRQNPLYLDRRFDPKNAVLGHFKLQRSPFAAQMRGKTAPGGGARWCAPMNFEAFDE